MGTQKGLNIALSGKFSQPYSLLGLFLTKTNGILGTDECFDFIFSQYYTGCPAGLRLNPKINTVQKWLRFTSVQYALTHSK